MKNDINFRKLTAEDIEVRLATKNDNGKGRYLLYKDARVDMRILDETFGVWGWQRSHQEVDGKVYCTVSIKSPSGEWISKSDAGSESRTEATKGEASDSFKRACFCWGIGRELYTSPDIWVEAQTDYERKNGVPLHVSHIAYNGDAIAELELCDNRNTVRYTYGKKAAPKEETTPKKKILRESVIENRQRLDKMLAQMEEKYRANPESFTLTQFLNSLGITPENDGVLTRLREIWMQHVATVDLATSPQSEQNAN